MPSEILPNTAPCPCSVCCVTDDEGVRNAQGICPICEATCAHCGGPREGHSSELGRCLECTVTCDDCGQEVDAVNGHGHCHDCVVVCAGCSDEVAEVDEHDHCEQCSIVCSDCGAHCSSSDDIDSYGHCSECCCQCPECGNALRSDDSLRDHGCVNCVSDEDDSEDDDGNNALHSYSFKPCPRFLSHGNGERTAMYFGMEIETELASGNLSSYMSDTDLPSEWYAKEDGSLNHGAEMVSHPGTMAYWETANWDWTKRAIKAGGRSYDASSCGMHVHVSRRALTGLAQWRIHKMFALNSEWVQRISRRISGRLERWAKVEPDTLGTEDRGKYDQDSNWVPKEVKSGYLAKKIKGGYGSDRYVALNLTSSTLEFRIFRGTLDKEAILRNLAIVCLLCNWASEGMTVQEMTPSKFLEWVGKSGYRYVSRRIILHVKELLKKCA